MVALTLVASAAFAFAAAGVYFIVGARLGARKVSAESQLAATMFATWWFGLALVTATGGLQSIAGALGLVDLPVYLTLTLVNLLVLCVALLGLVYYLVYLFTGKRKALYPLAAFYLFYFALLLYFVLQSQPTGVDVKRWNVTLHYANQVTSGPLFVAVVAGLLLPQILGALAYFTLYFRVQERALRFRILVVSWSIILWFGSVGVAAATGLSQDDAWQIVSRAIGLGAALAILIAYNPPGFLKRRFHLTAVGEESPAPQGAAPPSREARHGVAS